MRYILLLIFSFCMSSSAAFKKGDAYRGFFWIHYNNNDTLIHGNYGYIKIDSIAYTDSSTLILSHFGLPNYKWWIDIFNKAYFSSSITIKNSKPEIVDLICSNFDNVQWLESFEQKDSSNIIRFLFPILSQDKQYHCYDYFDIILNDSTALQFQFINDTTTIGTFLNNRHHGDGRTVIKAKAAIVVRVTNENPFRIKTIQFDTTRADLISLYLKYDFTSLIDNAKWFGLSILDDSLYIVETPQLLRYFIR